MNRTRAILMLLVTTAAWGLSFPCGKALMAALEPQFAGSDTWFLAALNIGARFGVGALLLFAFNPRVFAQATESEWRQGLGLGLFGGLGLLIQADGLAHTHASTSAFLTQFTAVLVPAVVAFRDRHLPSARTVICVFIVMVGVAVLGRFNVAELRIGRGELETLISAAFFTGMMLWLERPLFRGNSVSRVTIIMFATIAVVLLPVVILRPGSLAGLNAELFRWPVMAIFLVLTLVCSVFAFLTMNRWQPEVDATTAGIVYCAEPIFATLFALYLPAWLAPFVGVDYLNESFTLHLVIGGVLITAANVMMAMKPQIVEPGR